MSPNKRLGLVHRVAPATASVTAVPLLLGVLTVLTHIADAATSEGKLSTNVNDVLFILLCEKRSKRLAH